MNQQLKISFSEKIKRPDTGNKFTDALLKILVIPLFPVFMLFALLVMLFAMVISLWQRLAANKRTQEHDFMETEKQNKQWNLFTSSNTIQIHQQLAGSLPWDSGDYLYLKSDPVIPYLTNKLFGDWLFADFGGIFLQKWNDTRNINCDLIFIDFDTCLVTELKTGLPTKHWTAEKINSSEIKFTFTTAESYFTYIVKRTDINS